jgi:hypothetical protein
VQRYICARCHEEAEYRQRLLACKAPIDDTEGRGILDLDLADPEVVRGLRFWITNLAVARRVLMVNQRLARDLASLVADELR